MVVSLVRYVSQRSPAGSMFQTLSCFVTGPLDFAKSLVHRVTFGYICVPANIPNVCDHRFVWTAQTARAYVTATMSLWAINTAQRVKVQIIQRDDVSGIAWTGTTKVYVQVDGTGKISYYPISSTAGKGSSVTVTTNVTNTDLIFTVTNSTEVKRSGYVVIQAYTTTGQFSSVVVDGGTCSVRV